MASHGAIQSHDFIAPRSRYFESGKFGRLFGSLPPFAPDNPSLRGAELFCEVQRLVRWRYQWIVRHDFLPLTCGQAPVADVLDRGRSFYKG